MSRLSRYLPFKLPAMQSPPFHNALMRNGLSSRIMYRARNRQCQVPKDRLLRLDRFAGFGILVGCLRSGRLMGWFAGGDGVSGGFAGDG